MVVVAKATTVVSNSHTPLDHLHDRFQVLNVLGNFIGSTEPLSHLPNLMKLCISENRIMSIKQVEILPATLADLYLSPNPVSELPHFRLQVLRRQPQLRLLDDFQATPQEKVKANVAYGDDVGEGERGVRG